MIRRALVTSLLIFAPLLSLGLFPGQTRAASPDKYCRYGDRLVLIFIDRTTAYDDVDKEIFVSGFEGIVAELELGDRVVVQTITDSYGSSDVTFRRCVPGCPDTGMMGWLFAECRALQARADFTEFRRDLATNIRQMLDEVQSYKRSDIARTVAQATRLATAARFGEEPQDDLSALIVFSDLLENSETLPWPSIVNHGSAAALEAFKKVQALPQLGGANVVVFGVGRLHDEQRSPLPANDEMRVTEFWKRFFREAGASNIFIGRRLD